MPAPRIGTLGDLEREGSVITVYCTELHSASWPGWYLAQQFGADLPLQTFMDRCRCHCGRRADDLKAGGFAFGTGIGLDRRSPYQAPGEVGDVVRAIGALAVALTRADSPRTSP